MTLSVIIPVYNVAPYLRRCVESVLRQTYRNMEIILVDDGSTDESGAICDEYASASFASFHHSIIPIRVIHKPNGGLSDARNAGLKVATGEYVIFLDSDDEWLVSDGIEQIMRRLKQRQSDVLLFKYVDVYPNKKQYARDYDADYIRSHSAQEVFEKLILTERFSTGAWSFVSKRLLLETNNLQFRVGLLSEDVDFACRLWQKAKSVDALNIDMYGYYHRSGSISTSYSIRNLLSFDWMFTYWKKEIGNQCINYATIGAYLANWYVSCSYSFFSIARRDRKHAKQILLNHQEMLLYAASKKSLRMKKVVDQLGINVGIFIFATYGQMKKYYCSILC